jgi:hypothetical protein
MLRKVIKKDETKEKSNEIRRMCRRRKKNKTNYRRKKKKSEVPKSNGRKTRRE